MRKPQCTHELMLVWGPQAAQLADEDAGKPRVWLPGEGWVVVEPVEDQQDEAGYTADDEVSDRDTAAASEAGQQGMQVWTHVVCLRHCTLGCGWQSQTACIWLTLFLIQSGNVPMICGLACMCRQHPRECQGTHSIPRKVMVYHRKGKWKTGQNTGPVSSNRQRQASETGQAQLRQQCQWMSGRAAGKVLHRGRC